MKASAKLTFLLGLILAGAVGWGIALVLNGVLGSLGVRLLAAGDSRLFELRFTLGAFAIGLIMGLAIGIPQLLVLGRTFSFSWIWVLACGVGAGLGLGLTYLFFRASPTALFVVSNGDPAMVVASMAMFSFCLALFQAGAMVRKRYLLSLLWLVIASLLGVIGLGAGYVIASVVVLIPFGTLTAVGQSGWVGAQLFLFLAGAFAGGLLGLGTGGVLLVAGPRKMKSNLQGRTVGI